MTSKAVDPIQPVDDSTQQAGKAAAQENPGGNADTLRPCPNCHIGRLVFDGCLNLTCSVCGYTDTGGGFT